MGQKKPRRRGRKTLLTEDLIATIAKDVTLGLPIELAAEANGISRQTVLEWVRRGEGREDGDRPPKKIYVEFANRYRRARAAFAKALMAPCLEAFVGRKSKKDPSRKLTVRGALGRAHEAHWHLARRFPEYWGSGREHSDEAFGIATPADTGADTPEQGVTIEIVYGPPEPERDLPALPEPAPADNAEPDADEER